MAKILPKNLDFSGHQKFFCVDTKRKYGPFKSKNNTQIDLKQLPNNLEKSQNLDKKYAKKKIRQKKYAHHHPLNKGHDL